MTAIAPALSVTETPKPYVPRLRDGLPFAAKVFAAVWIGWAVLGMVASVVSPGGEPINVPGLDAAPLTGGWHNLLDSGDRWDALWYQRIAAEGYRPDDGSAAFFPLYPLATHVVCLALFLSTRVASFVVAQGCLLASLCVLYALTTREFGAQTARRATKYLALFPTAFFLLAPYAESQYLLLVLLAFWYARSGRWGPAALCAMGASLTRSAGVVVGLALLVEAVIQWRTKQSALAPKLAAACAPLAGLAGYCLYWALSHGDAYAPLNAQRGWGRVPMFPLVTLYHAVETAIQNETFWMIDLLVVAIAAVSIVAGVRLIPACYSVFAGASLLMPLANPWPPRPLMSVPRFAAVLFPVFWVIALATQRWRLSNSLVVAVFAGGYTLMGVLFARWYGVF